MKTNILSMTIIAIMAGIIVTSCGETSKKDMKSAKENMGKAGQDLKEAASAVKEENRAYVETNWQEFQGESEEIIINTEIQIKELREKIAKSATKDRKKLNVELDKLEQKNKDLKEKLTEQSRKFRKNLIEFKEGAGEKEKSFELEFKHDMDELDTSLKDFFKNNVE